MCKSLIDFKYIIHVLNIYRSRELKPTDVTQGTIKHMDDVYVSWETVTEAVSTENTNNSGWCVINPCIVISLVFVIF